MDENEIKITVHIINGEFFTNASMPDGSFCCTIAQPTLDMSLASAMPFIRSYAEQFQPSEPKEPNYLVDEDWLEAGLTEPQGLV